MGMLYSTSAGDTLPRAVSPQTTYYSSQKKKIAEIFISTEGWTENTRRELSLVKVPA
jgi:hypothetical protein